MKLCTASSICTVVASYIVMSRQATFSSPRVLPLNSVSAKWVSHKIAPVQAIFLRARAS